jgi:hypothetical protein
MSTLWVVEDELPSGYECISAVLVATRPITSVLAEFVEDFADPVDAARSPLLETAQPRIHQPQRFVPPPKHHRQRRAVSGFS